MRNSSITTGALLLLAPLTGLAAAADAQRLDYPPEEFQQRRTAFCSEITGASPDLTTAEGAGRSRPLAVLFAANEPDAGVKFRQDHDFYYLTGNEDKNAIVAIDLGSCEATLFLPPQTAREASRDGWNWLYEEDAADKWGFREIRPLHYFDEFLARRRIGGRQPLWVRLSERDLIDQSRTDAALFFGRRLSNPWAGQASEDAWRITQWRQRYPHFDLFDLTPAVDELRMHKTPLEVEALKRTGEISSRAMIRAISATVAGRHEYALEAEATHEMITSGAELPAYPAIVGAAANGIIWHYNKNGKQLENGDVIVMDYGASLGYQTMDITRTWPVGGKFTDLQERAYLAVLEAEKAIIAAMKPGVLRSETRRIAREIFDKHGFEGQYPGGAGHFVGMAVHDVGDYDRPLEEGMVIAVEPIIEFAEHDFHIRIEDTVLVTKDGTINLSASVPKELDEVLALVGSAAKGTAATSAGQQD